MQYTDTEAALIGGLISNYFFQPSVDETLRESYRPAISSAWTVAVRTAICPAFPSSVPSVARSFTPAPLPLEPRPQRRSRRAAHAAA